LNFIRAISWFAMRRWDTGGTFRVTGRISRAEGGIANIIQDPRQKTRRKPDCFPLHRFSNSFLDSPLAASHVERDARRGQINLAACREVVLWGNGKDAPESAAPTSRND